VLIEGCAVQIAGLAALVMATESNQSSRLVLLAALALFALSIIACAAFLTWMRRVTG
jgi:hypothetical protein